MNRRSTRQSMFRTTVFFLSVCLAVIGQAEAGVVNHTVRSGESLSAITRDFYGDKELFGIIALYNGIPDATTIQPGSIVRLPYSELITVGPGESLSLIAKRVWKNARFYTVLAEVNDITRPEAVPAGTRIRIPVMVPYRLGKGESLSTVARDFYGNPGKFPAIAVASGIDDPARVSVGTGLKVPLVLVKTARATQPPPQKTKPKRTSQPRTPDKAGLVLKQASEAYRQGEYAQARDLLSNSLMSMSLSDKPAALRLLASCHLAFGDRERALDALREAHRLEPGYRPQPAMVNPELMELYEQAMGKR